MVVVVNYINVFRGNVPSISHTHSRNSYSKRLSLYVYSFIQCRLMLHGPLLNALQIAFHLLDGLAG